MWITLQQIEDAYKPDDNANEGNWHDVPAMPILYLAAKFGGITLEDALITSKLNKELTADLTDRFFTSESKDVARSFVEKYKEHAEHDSDMSCVISVLSIWLSLEKMRAVIAGRS